MTFRKKLIIAFVSIGVFPLIMLGVLMMNRMVDQYISDRIDDLQVTSHAHIDSLNQIFASHSITMETIAASTEVNYYLEYFKRYQSQAKMTQFWNNYDQANIYIRTLAIAQSKQIKNIFVLPMDSFAGITAYGMEVEVPYSREYLNWTIYNNTIKMNGRYLWSISTADKMPNPLPSSIQESDYYLFLSALLYGGYNFKPCGVVVIQFNERYLRSLIQTILSTPNTLFTIVNSELEMMYHSDNTKIGKVIDDQELLELLTTAEHGVNNIIKYHSKDFFLSHNELSVPGWRLLSFTSIDSLRPANWIYTKPIILFILVGVAIAVLISLVLSHSLYTPIRELCDVLNNTENTLSIRMPDTRKDEFGMLYRKMNSFIDRIQTLINQVKLENQLKNEANMNALRSQINPHFLYNTLNIIICLADMKKFQSIRKTVISLISLLRASIGDTRELITISEEMKLVSDYLTIQHLRTDFEFVFKHELEPALTSCKIQKFILQPLVENCLVHAFPGVNIAQEEACTVFIRGKLIDGKVVFDVIDNGRGLTEQQFHEINDTLRHVPNSLKFAQIGLQNVNTRIKLLFGDQFGLSFLTSENGGAIVRIIYPVVE